jgi:hypothetical protein
MALAPRSIRSGAAHAVDRAAPHLCFEHQRANAASGTIVCKRSPSLFSITYNHEAMS